MTSSKLRVLLISHTCQSAVEGQPKARCLGRLPDIDLQVLVPDRWMHYGRWRTPDVPVDPSYTFNVARAALPWAGPAQFYLHFYPRLRKVLREFQPDVIDLWEEPWSLVSAHACYLRNRMLPCAAIVSETEQNLDKRLPLPFEQFRRYTLRQADFVVGRNREALDIVRSRGYAGPSAVVPNAVDTRTFVPMDREACRRALNVEGLALGYAGRLVEAKGLDELVEALRYLPTETRLYLAGEGEYRAALEKKIGALDLTRRVVFIGNLSAAKLAEFFNAIDVFVLPSRTTMRWKEQFGRVIIEAQACGAPVVGSSSGAIPEVIADAGLIFLEGDAFALAEAVGRLSQDAALRGHCRESGLARARKLFAWPRVAETMADIYRRVVTFRSALQRGVVRSNPLAEPLQV